MQTHETQLFRGKGLNTNLLFIQYGDMIKMVIDIIQFLTFQAIPHRPSSQTLESWNLNVVAVTNSSQL